MIPASPPSPPSTPEETSSQSFTELPEATKQTDTSSPAFEQILAAKHKKLEKHQAERPFLFLRNILNGIFILLAVIAMIGIGLSKSYSLGATISYYIAIIAVLVKVIEVIFRMPGFREGKFPFPLHKSSRHK